MTMKRRRRRKKSSKKEKKNESSKNNAKKGSPLAEIVIKFTFPLNQKIGGDTHLGFAKKDAGKTMTKDIMQR